jgi:hypothetical protein
MLIAMIALLVLSLTIIITTEAIKIKQIAAIIIKQFTKAVATTIIAIAILVVEVVALIAQVPLQAAHVQQEYHKSTLASIIF